MRTLFFLIGSFFFQPHMLHAQQQTQFYAFPSDWLGVWQDTLRIYGVDSVKMAIPMELAIEPLDSLENNYTWGLTYGDKASDYRPYELKAADAAKGLWVIDEKNTIKIEGYLRGNAFSSWFVVEGSRVLCLYERTEAGIEFRVIAGAEVPVSTTGKGEHEGEKISEVKTYPASAFQKALLKKQK